MTTYLKGVRETLSTYEGDSSDTDNAKQRLSGKLWRDFDFERAAQDPSYGWYGKDVWKNGTGTFTGTQASAGAAALVAGPTGFGTLLEIDSNSGTAAQGYQVQFTGHGYYPKAGETLYFEAQLRAHDIATAPEFFAGHGTIDTTFIATSGTPSVTAADFIGFYAVDDGAGLTFAIDDGDTGESAHASDVYTLVDADVTTDGSEWVHLGYRITFGDSVEAYANGLDLEVSVTQASEPDGFIVPTFVCQSSGSSVDPLIRVAHTCWAVKH